MGNYLSDEPDTATAQEVSPMQPTVSRRTDYSGLIIRLLLLLLAAIGVIGIFLVAPPEAATLF